MPTVDDTDDVATPSSSAPGPGADGDSFVPLGEDLLPRSWLARPELRRALHVGRTVLVLRITFLVVGWLGRWILENDAVRPHFGLDHWLQWDAHHYLGIAELGYDETLADGNVVGFYPGFPFTTRAVSELTGAGLLVAGMLVSFVATWVAATFLHRLAEHDGHDGDRAVLALLLFPTAVFLVAPYTEALFLAGAVPAFYYARTNRPLAAAPWALLATFARAVGPIVTLAVLVELLRHGWPGRDLRRLLALGAVAAAGALPAVAHGLAFAEREGTVFAYAAAQGRITGRGLHDPLDGLRTTLDTWSSGQSAGDLVTFQLEVVFAAACVVLLVWLLVRRAWGYATFVGITLGLALASPYWLSNPRFALTLFPFAFLLSDLGGTRRGAGLVTPVLASASTLGVITFVRGEWFF